jgi:hypothetical protein
MELTTTETTVISTVTYYFVFIGNYTMMCVRAAFSEKFYFTFMNT